MHSSVYKIKFHTLISRTEIFPAAQIEAEPAAGLHLVIQRPFKIKQ